MKNRERGAGERTETAGRNGLTRRGLIKTLGAGALGAGLASAAGSAEAQTVAEELSWAPAGRPPYEGVRIAELSSTLAGRLAGLLFADQGAEVFTARDPSPDLDDTYFDRGKTVVPPAALADLSGADVVIVDGDTPISRAAHQVVLRIVAALPGDEAYGHLPADCSEDLLNALVGFFTDMSITGPMLGRPVIYTPLPLCSVYAGVNGAVAVGSALVDRVRTGHGREVTASRIAGGLSAIGALNLTNAGLPEHLMPIQIGGLPPGLSPEAFTEIVARASAEPAEQNWLEQRFAPLAAPFRCADGRFILPLAGANRRLGRWCLQVLGVYDEALGLGIVDANPFDPANFGDARNNLADSLALRFDLTSGLADRLTPIFASRTAAEWQAYFAAHDMPATVILSFEEWLEDAHARQSGLIAAVRGTDAPQIGRMAWVDSAAPYASLSVAQSASAVPPRSTPAPDARADRPSARPLSGYRVLDLGNVVAAPSCGRMLAELGADVTLVVPMVPYHSPTIVAAWSGEYAAGKKSVIVDAGKPEGLDIIRRLAADADIVSGNFLDDQLARLRLDPVSLRALNATAIGLQITALRGERGGPRFNDKGYDPSVQGTVGISNRFGGPDSPTYHGIASAVDYLCGYLGVWAGVSALYAREAGGGSNGDWAETSLAAAATLTQLLLQSGEPPESAVGQQATGMTASARVYRLADGWIFAQAPSDATAELAELTVTDALAALAERGIPAVPVQTCRGVADRHREAPSRTATFERTEKDGWATEMFAPTWFVFDNAPFSRSAAATRVGGDAAEILSDIGYGPEDLTRLQAAGVVGRTEWARS